MASGSGDEVPYLFMSTDDLPYHYVEVELLIQFQAIWMRIRWHFMVLLPVNMEDELLRFVTFFHFPQHTGQDIRILASSGFYYFGQSDTVVCYCCGLCRRKWARDDVPFEIHRRLSPTCPFVLNNVQRNRPYFRLNEGGFRDSLITITQPPIQGFGVRPEQSDDNNVISLANRTHNNRRRHVYVERVERHLFSSLPDANLQPTAVHSNMDEHELDLSEIDHSLDSGRRSFQTLTTLSSLSSQSGEMRCIVQSRLRITLSSTSSREIVTSSSRCQYSHIIETSAREEERENNWSSSEVDVENQELLNASSTCPEIERTSVESAFEETDPKEVVSTYGNNVTPLVSSNANLHQSLLLENEGEANNSYNCHQSAQDSHRELCPEVQPCGDEVVKPNTKDVSNHLVCQECPSTENTVCEQGTEETMVKRTSPARNPTEMQTSSDISERISNTAETMLSPQDTSNETGTVAGKMVTTRDCDSSRGIVTDQTGKLCLVSNGQNIDVDDQELQLSSPTCGETERFSNENKIEKTMLSTYENNAAPPVSPNATLHQSCPLINEEEPKQSSDSHQIAQTGQESNVKVIEVQPCGAQGVKPNMKDISKHTVGQRFLTDEKIISEQVTKETWDKRVSHARNPEEMQTSEVGSPNTSTLRNTYVGKMAPIRECDSSRGVITDQSGALIHVSNTNSSIRHSSSMESIGNISHNEITTDDSEDSDVDDERASPDMNNRSKTENMKMLDDNSNTSVLNIATTSTNGDHKLKSAEGASTVVIDSVVKSSDKNTGTIGNDLLTVPGASHKNTGTKSSVGQNMRSRISMRKRCFSESNTVEKNNVDLGVTLIQTDTEFKHKRSSDKNCADGPTKHVFESEGNMVSCFRSLLSQNLRSRRRHLSESDKTEVITISEETSSVVNDYMAKSSDENAEAIGNGILTVTGARHQNTGPIGHDMRPGITKRVRCCSEGDTLGENNIGRTFTLRQINTERQKGSYKVCAGSPEGKLEDPDFESEGAKPKLNPNCSEIEQRRRTFRNNLANPSEKLAYLGCECAGNGKIRCKSCRKEIQDSDLDSEIWIDHARISPQCGFLLERKGQDFVKAVTMGETRLLRMYRGIFNAESMKMPFDCFGKRSENITEDSDEEVFI